MQARILARGPGRDAKFWRPNCLKDRVATRTQRDTCVKLFHSAYEGPEEGDL